MSPQANRIIPLILSMALSACAIVSFDEVTVESNLPQNGGIFLEESILLSFSLPVEPNSAEDIVSLVEGSSTIAIDKEWISGRLRVTPSGGWKKGLSYRLDLSGDVMDTQGRVFKPDYSRAFTYGDRGELLGLTLWTPGQGALIVPDGEIEMVFSKPISQTSFTDAFSLNPYRETEVTFSADSLRVRILPREGWEPLQVYRWSLKNLRAADDYCMDKEYTGIIQTDMNLEQPGVTDICPAVALGDGQYSPLTGTSLDGQLAQGQPIAILFTEPMDRKSLSDSLTITPSLGGSLVRADTTDTTFVFIPDAVYSRGVRYRLVIQKTAKAQNGLTLGREYETFFTPDVPFLEVTSVILNGTPYSPLPPSNAIASQQIASDTLTVTISFSQALDFTERIQAVSAINLEPLFPVTALIPRLLQAGWSPDGSTITMVWENFSVDSDVKKYYRLKVNATNMEESACLVFYTVP